jgi:hypothetical protein
MFTPVVYHVFRSLIIWLYVKHKPVREEIKPLITQTWTVEARQFEPDTLSSIQTLKFVRNFNLFVVPWVTNEVTWFRKIRPVHVLTGKITDNSRDAHKLACSSLNWQTAVYNFNSSLTVPKVEQDYCQNNSTVRHSHFLNVPRMRWARHTARSREKRIACKIL